MKTVVAYRKTVVAAYWTEYERGWGQRSDGISIHLTIEDAKEYERRYIDRNHTTFYAPDCYSQVSSFELLSVPEDVYDLLFVTKSRVLWFNYEKEITG